MLDTYIYVQVDKLNGVEGCGLKLSEWFDRTVNLDGNVNRYISSLLNPRDDDAKFKSKDYRCLKLEVESEYCVIAEGAYYSEEFAELYIQSFTTSDKYILGTYRKPESIIGKTILPHEIKGIDKRLSFAVFYENSHKIYLNNILENLRDNEPLLDEIMLYYYQNNLTQNNTVTRFDINGKLAIFTQENTGERLILNIPKIREDFG